MSRNEETDDDYGDDDYADHEKAEYARHGMSIEPVPGEWTHHPTSCGGCHGAGHPVVRLVTERKVRP